MDSAFDRADLFFESLGRALILLDDQFRIIQAGRSFDGLICDGAANRVSGRTLDDLIFGERQQTVTEIKRRLRAGEVDEGRRAFLNCPLRGTRLVSVSSAAAPSEIQLEDPNAVYFCAIKPAQDQATTAFGRDFIAVSPAIQHIDHMIDLLQQSDATVLITGESGTGKEVIARAIHKRSPQREGPFVAVNCSAFPDTLLENELFGHVRGAYTGAHRDKPGRLELARGGTLFLDEIGDVPLPLQVKLLRVLQERQYEKLGDPRALKLEARIIAATDRDLELMIQRNEFRDDLYYRLRVIPIHIPPLRQRKEDIEALARFLMTRIAERTGRQQFLPSLTMRALLSYPWPGNVRELENALEYAATISQGQFIQVDELPQDIRDHAEVSKIGHETRLFPEPVPIESQKTPRSQLVQALTQCRWNKSKAAEHLGISRTTLWRRMKAEGLV